VPVEVKLLATLKPAMSSRILALRQDLGEKLEPGYVIHSIEIQLLLTLGVQALPFVEL